MDQAFASMFLYLLDGFLEIRGHSLYGAPDLRCPFRVVLEVAQHLGKIL